MGEFTKNARLSGRVHISEKEKLKKSGYTTGQAVEYFNKIITNQVDSLNIEEFFLKKEIEEAKLDLIVLEMKLEEIQKQKQEINECNLSESVLKSYKVIYGMYGDNKSNESFSDFIKGNYIQGRISSELSGLGCSLNEYMSGLLDYHNNVIHGSVTF